MPECCENLENRADGHGPRGPFSDTPPPAGTTITHCTVCQCRHIEVDAETGALGVLGLPL